MHATSGAATGNAILLLPECGMQVRGESPEQVMEEIQLRATLVSSVLEDILLKPHGEQWEFDD